MSARRKAVTAPKVVEPVTPVVAHESSGVIEEIVPDVRQPVLEVLPPAVVKPPAESTSAVEPDVPKPKLAQEFSPAELAKRFPFRAPPVVSAKNLPPDQQSIVTTLVSKWVPEGSLTAASAAVGSALASDKLALAYQGDRGPVVVVEHDLKYSAESVKTASVRRGRILMIFNEALRVSLTNRSS